MHTIRLLAALGATLLALPAAHAALPPASNAFTFQGRMLESDRPAAGPLEASFQLFASPLGLADPVSPRIVRTINFDNQGRFTVVLDFGQTFNGFPIFNGDERYLQIVLLDPPGGLEEDYPLSPRTPLTAAPLAAYALNARIPSLAEITEDRLESTDDDGSLAINVYDDDLGLTIREAGRDGARYSYSGIAATEDFLISTSDGDLSLTTAGGSTNVTSAQKDVNIHAGQGIISLVGGQAFTVLAGGSSSLTLGPAAFNIDAASVDINVANALKLDGTTVNITSGGILKLTSALTQITGPLIIQDHQFNPSSVILSGTLSVTGTGLKPGGGPWGTLSDARLKHNVKPLYGSLRKINRLRPVSFEYKPGHPLAVSGEFRGFIAQDVLPVLPEWVTADENGVLLLTPVGFEALVVHAIQELDEQHRRELEKLERENRKLEDRIEKLERAVQRMTNEQG